MNCPLKSNAEKDYECPENNKKNGCAWWLDYTKGDGTHTAKLEGCAMTLSPMLLAENINALGHIAGEVNKVGAEVSAGRCENIAEHEASRVQFVNLAHGRNELVQANHHKGISA